MTAQSDKKQKQKVTRFDWVFIVLGMYNFLRIKQFINSMHAMEKTVVRDKENKSRLTIWNQKHTLVIK